MNYLKIFFLLFVALPFDAQVNLVPNPSFEDTASLCPDADSQIQRAKFWFRTNSSPDYFHYCYNGPLNYASVPSNGFGYQVPMGVNCKAYSGIFTASKGTNNVNETFATKLTDSLIKNNKYYFSYRVVLSNLSKYASNNLGGFFSTKLPKISLADTPLNQSQITFTQTVTDTLNWILLFKSYIADSNYKYISLGNFKDSSITTKTFFNPNGGNSTYYYIDNVCLSSDSAFSYNYTYNCTLNSVSEINKEIGINIFPNPASNTMNIEGLMPFSNIKIFDYSGRIVFDEKVESNSLVLEIKNLSSGFYFVKITCGYKEILKKLIIQKQ